MTDHIEDIHPKHGRNKMLQAVRIGDALIERGGPTGTSETVAEMGDKTWARACQLLGESHVPGPTTRAMVVAYMETVEAKMAKAERLVKDLERSLRSSLQGDRIGSLEDFVEVLLQA